jgi:uncharacterized protein with ParB-like and HNH nuclease domain
MEIDTSNVTEAEHDLKVEELDVNDLKNVEDFSEGESTSGRAFSISSYGADYTVDSLVKRVQKGDFYVPPFQRSYVWTVRQASRFIESMLMGLPVPGIFVFREAASNRHLIIDGQQRLKSLAFFYSGQFDRSDKIFRLIEVREPWLGKTYDELPDFDKRRLDDSILHTTIFRQEVPQDNDDSVYEVFERINTGGVKLSPQEIRVCVNFGKFTELLAELSGNQLWRQLYGTPSPRLKDQELILRFFAFFDGLHTYKRPLKSFLNRYMESKKGIDDVQAGELSARFEAMVDATFKALGKKAFRPERALNTAVFDAVSVAISRRLAAGSPLKPEALEQAYNTLLDKPEFKALYSRATADEENVRERFKLAIETFEHA